MFSKKKAVTVLPRSRFAKAKPNLKVLPKNSQQKEKKPEESSISNPKESEISEIVTPKISDETFNKESEKSASLKDESKASEIETSEFSNKANNSNEFEKCATENKISTVEKYVSHGNVVPETSKETVPQHSKLQTANDNLCNSPSIDTPELVDNPKISSTISSPVKAIVETSIESNLHLKHANEITESPEKLSNCSPTKTSIVCSVDKSNRYPCITKLLSAPKKRSKNIEIRERKKMMSNYKDLPPRSEMTFTDLIFWNPHTSPMKSKESKTSLVFNPKEKETNPVEEEEEEEEDSVAPKLFVNEDGEIILDESSLVVKRKKTSVDMTSEAIIMDDSNITYSSFRRRVSKLWSPKETVKFYKALSVVGTDFALMENIMPNRTRRELKIKFKKEEKINMELLQRAMYETETFQTNLSMDDLNLDVIDIPGLEERIANNSTVSNGRKPGKRKQNAENSSDNNLNENDPDYMAKRKRGRPKKIKDVADISLSSSDSNALHFTNDPDYMVKRKRGRPKKIKDIADISLSSDSNALHFTNNASLIVNRGRGRPKKTIIRSSIDLPNTENESCDIIENFPQVPDELSPLIRKRRVKVLSHDSLESNENFPQESDELSPLIRKRRVKVLSQDSLESNENATDDLIEIEVQIESSKSNKSQDQKIAVSRLSDALTTDYDRSIFLEKESITSESHINPEESPTVSDDETTNGIISDSVPKEQLTLETSTTSSTKFTKERGTHKNPISEQSCVNRKFQKVKVNPNTNIQKNKSVSTKETFDIFQNGCIPFPASPSSIIEVTDEKLLSDSVTDVVTSAHTRLSKKSKQKLPYKNEQNTLQRLQPSFKNYTPEVDTGHYEVKKEKTFFNSISVLDEPVFFKNPNQRKYGYSKAKEHLREKTLPLPSSPLVDSLSNLNSSLETSLNVSSKEPITISVTPEQNSSENSSGVMLMAQSPEGNRLHFYLTNNFTGGLALPPQISVPPTNIVIKSEEENFNI